MTSSTVYKKLTGLLLYSFLVHLCTHAQSRFPTFEVNKTLTVTVDETERGIVANLNNNKTVFLKNGNVRFLLLKPMTSIMMVTWI